LVKQINNASIAVCSDSQAALKALSAAKVTSALGAETITALKDLAVFNSVRLVWFRDIAIYQAMRRLTVWPDKHHRYHTLAQNQFSE